MNGSPQTGKTTSGSRSEIGAGVSATTVQLDGVSKVFESESRRVVAVEEASLRIRSGEFVSLLGPSGCGKTTLMRIVGDLETPTEGTVTVNGLTPADARRRRQAGMVFQKPALLEWRTVTQNVTLPGEVFGDADVRGRAAEMIQKVGLSGFENAYPRELSGGMQSRVAIARALTHRPSILLMDEPFGALDEITRERLQLELLTVWAETNASVLFVTHSISEALVLSDRVVVMSARPGHIVEDVSVGFARPRDGAIRSASEFVALEAHLRDALNRDGGPDAGGV